ncbi:MAG: PHP domain-containing protein [Cyclobacteriaceae bacterium]|nr:PHP domain-containing protein [Cyclobacteriaceae bacterium]
MNRKIWILPLVLSAFVAIVAFTFHHPVHIENALTLQPEPDFEIQVSWLRIFFEPVLGVLLCFNRAFYALNEILVLLYWILGLFAVYTLVQSIRLKGKTHIKQFLLSQLLNLPVLVGLWFALLVILIFVPQHNDRIINKTADWVLVNTHSHTEFSHDGLISQEGLWKWHKRNGFDAFFITEHNNHNRSLEFVKRQRNNEFPADPAVFCGEEFSGSNHLSLLGLKTEFTSKGLSDSVVVAKARAEGAAIIVNHWFDGERKTLEYYRDLGADGFEIENTAQLTNDTTAKFTIESKPFAKTTD